jgi:hypothetical protein
VMRVALSRISFSMLPKHQAEAGGFLFDFSP